MTIKPENIKYVPLFEEHVAINDRFSKLPDQIKQDMSTIISLDENAVICGSLGAYLVGDSDVMPKGVDVIVRDASKLRLVECGNQCFGMPDDEKAYDETEMGVPQPAVPIDAVNAQEAQEEQVAQAEPGTIVIISVGPEGEIEDMSHEKGGEEKPKGWYDDEGNFNFESFKWVNGKPEGVVGSACVFETCGKIKTMPLALGAITVLVEEPGVMAEYRMKFNKMKSAKVKREKQQDFDSKKQPHVTKDNGMQDTPCK